MGQPFASLYGGYKYESPESRALGSITPQSYDYRDQGKLLSKLTSDVSYMSAYMRKMQKGIDEANQNFIQQIQSLIQEMIVLFAGGGDTGMDWGDLKYIFEALGALFGLQPGLPLPVNLFGAAWHFMSTYILPVQNFKEFIDQLIDTAIATVLDTFGEIPILGQALEQLAVIISTLRDQLGPVLDAFQILFDSFDITQWDMSALAAFLAPLKPIIDALQTIFGPYEEDAFQVALDALTTVTQWTGPFLSGLADIVNGFANSTNNTATFMTGLANLLLMFTNWINMVPAGTFNPVTAWNDLFSFILTSSVIPNMDASKIVTGVLNILRIPGLPAGQITSGTFLQSLIPSLTTGWGKTIDSSFLINAISSALIPNFDASKVTTGTFLQTLIPGLTSGWGKTIDASLILGAVAAAGFSSSWRYHRD
jgi:hypothetical protein